MPIEDKIIEIEKLLPGEGIGQERQERKEDEGESVLNAGINQATQRTVDILEEIT